MSDFRHVTNLQQLADPEHPYDGVDQALLDALTADNYRIGAPVPAKYEGGVKPNSYDQLVANRVVGLYVTFDGLRQPLVARKTGWGPPPLADWNKLPLYVET